MPIEFRCPQCMKLLRVGDDAMGKQAKCPACGSLAQVPNSLVEPVPPAFTPPPLPTAGNPFGPSGQNPFGGGYTPPLAPASDNPYAAPLSGGESTAGVARPTKITINGVFEDTWAAFKANFWMLIAVYFVEWIIGQAYANGGQLPLAIFIQAIQEEAVIVILVVLFELLSNLVDEGRGLIRRRLGV